MGKKGKGRANAVVGEIFNPNSTDVPKDVDQITPTKAKKQDPNQNLEQGAKSTSTPKNMKEV